MEMVRKMSAQVVACNEFPDTSSGEKAGTCTKHAQVNDLLQQVVELQETVNRLHSIRGAEMEIMWLWNYPPTTDTDGHQPFIILQ